MENLGVLYLILAGTILSALFVREYFNDAKHTLDKEFLIAMWLLHIRDLEDADIDVKHDQQALIEFLAHRNMKLPLGLVESTESTWLPENFIAKRKRSFTDAR